MYGLPGGWLELFEDWDECASRELKEEVNLDFKKKRFFNVDTFNCKHLDKKYHAISLIMYSEIQENEKKDIKNMEPNKCEKWFWVTINQLRGQMNLLFHPLKDFLKKHPEMDSVDYIRKLAKVPLNYLMLSSNSNSQKFEKKKNKSSDASDSTSDTTSSIKSEVIVGTIPSSNDDCQINNEFREVKKKKCHVKIKINVDIDGESSPLSQINHINLEEPDNLLI